MIDRNALQETAPAPVSMGMQNQTSVHAADLTHKKIAVLMGGPGSERKVSLASGAGVVKALRELGADVTEVDVEGPDFVVPPETEIAFNVIHGTFGEDGQVQRILEARAFPTPAKASPAASSRSTRSQPNSG